MGAKRAVRWEAVGSATRLAVGNLWCAAACVAACAGTAGGATGAGAVADARDGAALEVASDAALDGCVPACGNAAVPGPDGTCIPVGPRACPRCWDPGSSADCACGDVLPCPEGFAEAGGGAWCEPVLDECGDMEAPALGGGCAPVGNRACPKCWDPESEADCACGDLVPCGDGSAEVQDGAWCEPLLAATASKDGCGCGSGSTTCGGRSNAARHVFGPDEASVWGR